MLVNDGSSAPDGEQAGGLCLSPDLTEALQRAIAGLRRDANARCVLLTDPEGEVVAEAGAAAGLPLTDALGILVREVPISAALAGVWDEHVVLSLHHFEVGESRIYAASASDLPFLLVTLSWARAPAYSAVIWLFIRRTIQEMRGILRAEGLLGTELPGDGANEEASFGDLTPEQAEALGLVADDTVQGTSSD